MSPLSRPISPVTEAGSSACPSADTADFSHLGALASSIAVQFHLRSHGQRVALSTTWRAAASVGLGHHCDDAGGPSLAVGVAHVPHVRWSMVGSATFARHETQNDNLVLMAKLPPSHSTHPAHPTSSLAAVICFCVHSHQGPTWLPTAKALVFSHSQVHTLSMPLPSHTVSAIRIEFWPVTTWPNVQCLQSTPVHVKMMALVMAEQQHLPMDQCSPVPTLSSTHTGPTTKQHIPFGARAARWCPGPAPVHERSYGHDRSPVFSAAGPVDGFGVHYGSEEMSPQLSHPHAYDDAAETESYRHDPRAFSNEDVGRQDPPTLCPPVTPTRSCSSMFISKRAARPNGSSAKPSLSLGVQNGRISKPSTVTTSVPIMSKTHCYSPGSHVPTTTSDEESALAEAAARLMRGVSIMCVASSAGGQLGDNKEMGGRNQRIQVAIIKTPVGMRDFVQEF